MNYCESKDLGMFKPELKSKYGLAFNRLYTISNNPIHRFKTQLAQIGG